MYKTYAKNFNLNLISSFQRVQFLLFFFNRRGIRISWVTYTVQGGTPWGARLHTGRNIFCHQAGADDAQPGSQKWPSLRGDVHRQALCANAPSHNSRAATQRTEEKQEEEEEMPNGSLHA